MRRRIIICEGGMVGFWGFVVWGFWGARLLAGFRLIYMIGLLNQLITFAFILILLLVAHFIDFCDIYCIHVCVFLYTTYSVYY